MSSLFGYWQELIVAVMVGAAGLHAAWTLTPASLRLRALQKIAQRSLRAARWLAPLQRRLLAASGCSACSSARRPTAR